MQFPSFAILPASLSVIEVWLVRLFLLLAVMSIVPLLLFFVFDFLLYIWRWVLYEVPFVGGRAQGKRRPRAPSLVDNPAGRGLKAMVNELTHDDANSHDVDTPQGAVMRTRQVQDRKPDE